MALISLTGAARFESAMAVRPIARSAHFMVHHLAIKKLSTDHVLPLSEVVETSVDNSVDNRTEMTTLRLGLVVPKRHARRSVTRTLVKVQIRAGIRRHLDSLVAGDWVVRLRAPIDRKQFPSARSEVLAVLLHAEIDALLGDAARRARRALAQAVPVPVA
ncbi:MAG: ribonuclease P protein component [Sphaerotilus sp.]|nr:ribonuclease P protein component [Sphaerotilus sp.]